MFGKAVYLARLIDNEEAAPVALGEDVSGLFQGSFERLPVIGGGVQGGDLGLPLVDVHAPCALPAAPRPGSSFCAGEFRLLLAVALRVLAGNKLMPEFQLHALAGAARACR